MIEMKTLKINDKTYEIVDEKARNEIEEIKQNGTGGTVSEEDVRNAIESYMTENPIEIPSEYVTETELEEAMANVPTGSGGMSVSYDEEQEAIIFSGSSGNTGEEGSSAYDEYNITLTEDTNRIDVFSGEEYRKIEAYIIAKAETSEKMVFYPSGKYCQGVGNVPNGYYGAEKFEASIFDNSVNSTNLLTYCNGFANNFSSPVSVNASKTVIDQFYLTMATTTNVFKSGSMVRVYAYK